MPSELTLPTNEIATCDSVDLLIDALWETSFDLLGNIERMAAIVRRLDELGAKVDFDTNNAILPYIRMVASGRLLAKCLAAMAAEPALLEQALQAPLDVQEKMASGSFFEFLERDGTVTEKILFELTQKDILQLFNNGKIRTIEEQKQYRTCSRNRSVAQKESFQRHESKPYYESAKLPKIAGQVVAGPTRCAGCGAKLLPNAECLSCAIKSGDTSDEVDHGAIYRAANGIDDEDMPEGWQERLASVRAAKESDDELRFHADWLIARIAKGQLDDEDHRSLGELADAIQSVLT